MLIVGERECSEYDDEKQGESQEFQSDLLLVPKILPREKATADVSGLQDCNWINDNEFCGYCNGMKCLMCWATWWRLLTREVVDRDRILK